MKMRKEKKRKETNQCFPRREKGVDGDFLIRFVLSSGEIDVECEFGAVK